MGHMFVAFGTQQGQHVAVVWDTGMAGVQREHLAMQQGHFGVWWGCVGM